MFQVDDIWEEAKKLVGMCDDPKLFRWLSDAVTLTANKADFEGWKGFIDICTTNRGLCATMPREVDTVYGVTLGGHPTLGLGQLFNFHLNGPGEGCGSCGWTWQDMGGFHSVYRDITVPSKLVAYVQNPSDTGKALIVYGFDDQGNKLRRETSTGWLDGYQVPTIYGYAVSETGAPTVARVTAVDKALTDGPIRLSTIDDSGLTGTLLAVYEPDERFPQYRRIKLSRACEWIRVAYRKNSPIFRSRFDHVPLKSRIAFLLAVQAVKSYSEKDIAMAHAFESDAARLELEAQNASEAPTFTPIQVVGMNDLLDKSDYDIR